MKKTNFKRLLFEFLSITFAVLLGLTVNQWNENRKNKNLAETSLENIYSEIESNKNRVEVKVEEHKKTLETLNKVIEQLEIKGESEEVDIVFYMEFMEDSAWKTAQLTNAISHMPIESVRKLSAVYETQNFYRNFANKYIIKQSEYSGEKSKIETAKELFFAVKSAISFESGLLDIYNQVLKGESSNTVIYLE